MTKTARMSHKQHQHLSKKHKIVAQRMTLIYQQQQEKVFISGGEVLEHCTNNKENMASLPGDLQADLFVKLHTEDVKWLIDSDYLRMNLLSAFNMYIL